MYHQLPGPVLVNRTSFPGWLLVLALLCAAGFVVVRYAPTHFKETSAQMPSRPVHNFSIGDSEDLRHHLDNAVAAQNEAAAALRRSQDWIERALLDDDRLTVRRLQLARSAEKSAEGQINRAQEELEIAKHILIERSNKNETSDKHKRAS